MRSYVRFCVKKKKHIAFLLLVLLIISIVMLSFPTFSTASISSSPATVATEFNRLPMRHIDALLPPHGMKPLVPDEPVTLLARPKVALKKATPQSQARASHTLHKVQPGETLSKIAQKYYGNSQQWQKIYQANRGTLNNPNALRAGMVLVIP